MEKTDSQIPGAAGTGQGCGLVCGLQRDPERMQVPGYAPAHPGADDGPVWYIQCVLVLDADYHDLCDVEFACGRVQQHSVQISRPTGQKHVRHAEPGAGIHGRHIRSVSAVCTILGRAVRPGTRDHGPDIRAAFFHRGIPPLVNAAAIRI